MLSLIPVINPDQELTPDRGFALSLGSAIECLDCALRFTDREFYIDQIEEIKALIQMMQEGVANDTETRNDRTNPSNK